MTDLIDLAVATHADQVFTCSAFTEVRWGCSAIRVAPGGEVFVLVDSPDRRETTRASTLQEAAQSLGVWVEDPPSAELFVRGLAAALEAPDWSWSSRLWSVDSGPFSCHGAGGEFVCRVGVDGQIMFEARTRSPGAFGVCLEACAGDSTLPAQARSQARRAASYVAGLDQP